MKKFSFQLESVLRVRETRKKIAEKVVSITQSRLNKVVEDVDQVRQKKEQSYYFDAPGKEKLYWMGVCSSYRKGLNILETKLENQKSKLEEQLQIEKQRLIMKLREEKVMSTLKEAKFQEYISEVDKFEQKEMEELDILKRGKKK